MSRGRRQMIEKTVVSDLTGRCSVSQVIICTKEVSAGARKSAYNLLVEIGKAFVRFCGNAKGNTKRKTNIFFGKVFFLPPFFLNILALFFFSEKF